MKKQLFSFSLLALFLISLSSCEVIGGIFKAGMGVGIFIVIAIVAIIVFFIARGRKK